MNSALTSFICSSLKGKVTKGRLPNQVASSYFKVLNWVEKSNYIVEKKGKAARKSIEALIKSLLGVFQLISQRSLLALFLYDAASLINCLTSINHSFYIFAAFFPIIHSLYAG